MTGNVQAIIPNGKMIEGISIFSGVTSWVKSIWQKDDDCYTLAPLTDALRKQAEEKLNVTLPQSYINILKEKNGGSIIYDAYPTAIPTAWADDHIHIDHILGISEQEGILESEYLIQEWGLPKHIVVISGSGHSWVAFDYRNTREDPLLYSLMLIKSRSLNWRPTLMPFCRGYTWKKWKRKTLIQNILQEIGPWRK
jgi:hypothetical protein